MVAQRSGRTAGRARPRALNHHISGSPWPSATPMLPHRGSPMFSQRPPAPEPFHRLGSSTAPVLCSQRGEPDTKGAMVSELSSPRAKAMANSPKTSCPSRRPSSAHEPCSLPLHQATNPRALLLSSPSPTQTRLAAPAERPLWPQRGYKSFSWATSFNLRSASQSRDSCHPYFTDEEPEGRRG